MRKLLLNLHRSFGIIPDRASRYFSITMQTSLEAPLSNVLAEEHLNHIKNHEKNGALLLALQQQEEQAKNANFYYIFQSPNELQAYEFVKSGPFKEHIQTYKIEEIEMQSRTHDKELAPRHLRE